MTSKGLPHTPGPHPTETSSGSGTEDFEAILERELPPRIPSGEYPAVFVRAKRERPFGRPVIMLWFEILPDGSSTADLVVGKRLPLICPVRVNGGIAPSSKYARAWQAAAGRQPTRQDRMSTTIFHRRLLRIVVRTVIRDHHQQPIPEAAQYSIVDRILKAEGGQG